MQHHNTADPENSHSHHHGHGHGHGHHHGHVHGHDHGHDHRHNVDFSNINAAFIIAVAANLGFTLIEAIYGFLTDSVSLLGDAGHNLSDVLGLLLAWGASYLATRKSTSLYSYGFRRTTILAALINALVLVLASGFIAWESMERFFTPTPISEVAVMVVAGIGIFVNAGTALLFMKGGQSDLNLRGAFLHLAYDAAISAGVVAAALMIMLTGWLWLDPMMGILIVGVILAGTWGLLRDSVNLILDAVPQGIELDSVRDYLASIEGVSDVHDLHVWAMSTSENCLTAHLVMPENTLWDSDAAYQRIAEELQHKFSIHHVTLQVEKDQDCSNPDCC
ncbi:MAG: cation transporter [Pseudomonadales bacterium]|nr:cation transporter [Pseudomonadales bacterium]